MADISQRIANAKAEAESMQETINANKAAKADTTRMNQFLRILIDINFIN